VPEHRLPAGDPVHLPAVLSEAFGMSTSDVRRLVAQGGLKVEDHVVDALDLPRAELVGALVQAGKRRFVRLTD
jgi:tyrosyl-tRNA synthetase